jgi:hypothetical protein
MPLPALIRTGFQGSLLVNWQTERFDQYLAEYYSQVVRECVGDTAYIKIVAETATKWDDLFTGGSYFNTNLDREMLISGLTYAVKNFIWSRFVSDNFVPTNAGIKKPLGENSERASDVATARMVQNRYNIGVSEMLDILCYIDSYKDFEQDITSVTDNGGGSYTIVTDETKYLANGDTVRVEGVSLVVANLVDGVSFDVVSSIALDGAETYISNPYKDVVVGNLKVMI